ncbi:MAG: ROK family protein [Planctomycetota bacterium]|jgi:glucokinase|nr:ROK family protein [Planctomycetota bacterium]
MAKSFHIGLDLGGTAIKGGVLLDNTAVHEARCESPMNYEGCLEALSNHAKILAKAAGATRNDTCTLGLAAPGAVNKPDGVVLDSPNLRFLDKKPLRADLHARLGWSITLENDASAAALGESKFGAGKHHPSFLLVTLGTGIGGGVILDHQLWSGTGGLAGEFGHMRTHHERPCNCGGLGCVEAGLSSPQLLKWAQAEGSQADSLPALAQAADEADELALSIFKRAGTHFGEALAQVALLLDLRVFLLGGGGAPILPHLKESALQSLAARTLGRKPSDFVLEQATCGNRAGWLGAALSSL